MKGTFGLCGHNLSRFEVGQSIKADKLNALIECLGRARPVPGAGTGLDITQLPNGFASRVITEPGIFLALVTGSVSVSGASGNTLGSGAGQIETGSGASIDDPPGTPPAVTLYSNDTEPVKVGAYVVVAPFRDGYIILHARCGDLG